jgi:L-asparaginase
VRSIVEILATGGTIATHASRARSEVALSGVDLTRGVAAPPDIELETRDLFQTPSWMLDPTMMRTIAASAAHSAQRSETRGVVVTHGTTTLEYTAFMTDLFVGDETPVVFTGAMRSADSGDSDGPRNLSEAIAVACHEDARGIGVVACINGQVIGARDVWKQRREGLDAFVALYGSLGSVDESGVTIRRHPARGPVFRPEVEGSVALVKAFPGCDGVAIEACVGAGARGIVLEGLPGSGGIPPRMHSSIGRAIEQGIPVVLASRAPVGRIHERPTGGTGEPLLGLELISAGDLTAEKAWVALMVVLGQGEGSEDSVASFRLVAEPRVTKSSQERGES